MDAPRWIAPVWAVPFDIWTVSAPAAPEVAVSSPEPVVSLSAVEPSPLHGTPPIGMPVVAGLWIIGVAVAFASLMIGLLRLARLTAHAVPLVDAQWTDLARDVARTQGLRRPVALLLSQHPSLLVMWGLRRPTVVLPAGALTWSDRA